MQCRVLLYMYNSSMCIFSDAEVGGGICRINVQPGLQEIRGRIINTVSWRDEYVCRESKLTLVILTDARRTIMCKDQTFNYNPQT